jgi:tetratricopeptide (TPR) repeat protein
VQVNGLNDGELMCAIRRVLVSAGTYRQDTRKGDDLMPRIAELCADLGQHDKAIGLVRGLLRQANRPVAWLLNRQAMYEDARGNQPAAIRGYEEAGTASIKWGGPLFNLALLCEKQRDYPAALRAIERAIQAQDAPAYQTLKLRIRKHLKSDLDVTAQAKVVLASFGLPATLNDWELGWYICAAELARDGQAKQAGVEARRALLNPGAEDDGGVRPDMRRIAE